MKRVYIAGPMTGRPDSVRRVARVVFGRELSGIAAPFETIGGMAERWAAGCPGN